MGGVQAILESACTTVTYAPMLCVLFLGTRMRAIQLSQGETEKYNLPQPWVQGPKEIWGEAVPPVSPAVMSTIILTAIFFTVHLLVALCKTVEELRGELPPMLATVRE